jgi:hypothetical protein
MNQEGIVALERHVEAEAARIKAEGGHFPSLPPAEGDPRLLPPKRGRPRKERGK